MPSLFSEAETEEYYDHEDVVYRALWDKDGSVHWGLFEDGANMTFLEAGANLNRVMAQRGQLTTESQVIDVGCGERHHRHSALQVHGLPGYRGGPERRSHCQRH